MKPPSGKDTTGNSNGEDPQEKPKTDAPGSKASTMRPLTPDDMKLVTSDDTSPPRPSPSPTFPTPVTVTAPPGPHFPTPVTVTARPPPTPPQPITTYPTPVTVTAPRYNPCHNPGYRVNNSFISNNEGGQQTQGYHPTPNSGVTIATGFDLKGQTASSLTALGLPSSIVALLSPYTGLTGTAADNYLASNPLTVTTDQANTIDQAVFSTIYNTLSANYNSVATFSTFQQLPSGAQTAIFDVAFQYGTGLSTATPNFWTQITTGEWALAIANLNSFGDQFSSRRQRDATYLQQAVSNGIQSPSNPC